MSETRYVNWKEIKEAVKDRELDILRATGINWSGNHSHIDCPYPDHRDTGDNDWRWDADLRLAFCTCISRRSGRNSHSIFNVVECYEGVSFDYVKIRVAEIIG